MRRAAPLLLLAGALLAAALAMAQEDLTQDGFALETPVLEEAPVLGGFAGHGADAEVPPDVLAAVLEAADAPPGSDAWSVCAYETQVVAGTNHRVTLAPGGVCAPGSNALRRTFVVYEPLPHMAAGLQVSEEPSA